MANSDWTKIAAEKRKEVVRNSKKKRTKGKLETKIAHHVAEAPWTVHDVFCASDLESTVQT